MVIVIVWVAAARQRGRLARAWDARARRITLPVVSQFAMPPTTADAERAFESWVDRYERDVFGYLWRMTGDEQAAYDLSQETFLRAWRHFSKVVSYEQPRAWLLRVATHLAFNHRHRRAARFTIGDEAGLETWMKTSDPALRVVERDAIESALLLLPKRMRAALVLHDVYGYPSADIAQFLNISRAAAKMTISRAREQFRTNYREGASE